MLVNQTKKQRGANFVFLFKMQSQAFGILFLVYNCKICQTATSDEFMNYLKHAKSSHSLQSWLTYHFHVK